MLKALVIKELRESAGIVALAILACLYVLSDLIRVRGLPWTGNSPPSSFPFVDDMFISQFALIVAALAVALGLKQSAWEAGQNTYQFLLHRPAGRWFIFGTKLFVGCGLLFATGGLAIVAYALWADTPGNSPTPFFWSMTADEWQLLVCLSLVYLGAFLSGIRPARWFGTRLAPLITTGGAAFVFSFLAWWWAFSAILFVAAVALTGIFYYANTRDY